jgi:DNA-binding IclR family transcriptional regulator
MAAKRNRPLLPGRSKLNGDRNGESVVPSKKPQAESEAVDNIDEKPVAAVERALEILNAFKLSDGALSLAVLSERTGLYKSTILRLIATLERYGYVARTPSGGYRVGHKPLALGSMFQRSAQSPDTILPVLEALVRKTGESASFMIPQGDFRVCLYRVDSPHAVREYLRAGDVKPLDRGAAGRVMLAFLKPDAPAGAKTRRAMTATSLAEITPGVTSVAAPVFGPGGRVIGSLSFSGPRHRFGASVLTRMRTILLDEARRLTATIGGDPSVYDPPGHATRPRRTSIRTSIAQ